MVGVRGGSLALEGEPQQLLLHGFIALGGLSQTGHIAPFAPDRGSPQVRAHELLRDAAGVLGGVLLTETPRRRVLARPVRRLSAAELPRQLSASLRSHAIVRPRTLVLRRRYLDPSEDYDLGIEELLETARVIHGLVNPLCPDRISELGIRQEVRFARSFSTDQLQRLRSGRLPLSGLRPEQVRDWFEINRRHGYGDIELSYRQALQVLAGWRRCLMLRGGMRDGTSSLILFCPGAHGGRDVKVQLGVFQRAGITRAAPPARRLAPASLADAQPSMIVLSPRKPASAGFRKPTPSFAGPTTLGGLIAVVESSSGSKVTIPGYARSRTLMVFAKRPQAEQLVGAVQDLYGWQLTPVGRNGHALGPPKIAPARDALDFNGKVRTALPLALHHAWSREAAASVEGRVTARLSALAASTKFRGDWRTLRVVDIDKGSQRIVARLVFDRLVAALSKRYLRRVAPPAWLVTPEAGYFSLKGGSGPRAHPLLEFHVRRPDGLEDRWGWYVGTNSIESPISGRSR